MTNDEQRKAMLERYRAAVAQLPAEKLLEEHMACVQLCTVVQELTHSMQQSVKIIGNLLAARNIHEARALVTRLTRIDQPGIVDPVAEFLAALDAVEAEAASSGEVPGPVDEAAHEDIRQRR